MDAKEISKKLVMSRMAILRKHPFFGRLLLHLSFGLADCGTAYTDMRRIVFDPEFAARLSDEEINFVLLHEVLHCALKHCTRGEGKQQLVYNIACDIVVNSTAMHSMGISEMIIDKEAVMHIAPDGSEGRTKNAEEVYKMLMKMSPQDLQKMYGDKNTDNHSVWKKLPKLALETIWNSHVKEASKSYAKEGSGISEEIERQIAETEYLSQTDWRLLLHDFIRNDKKDYSFSHPDRRYSADFILPSFCDVDEGGRVENMWVLIDTSASVSPRAIGAAYKEIVSASEQIGNLSGFVSFFDSEVSEPRAFEDVGEFLEIKPVGYGGTWFQAIFDKLEEWQQKDVLPECLIIITDGYSEYPDEEAALGVPVIWLIVDSEMQPPWGVCAHINTKGEQK